LALAPGGSYDYIYTSLPFVWFEECPDTVPAKLAMALRRYLRPGGILLVDSDDQTERNGRSWQLAKLQIAYFTARGFRFDESQRFIVRSGRQECDTAFTELKFIKT